MRSRAPRSYDIRRLYMDNQAVKHRGPAATFLVQVFRSLCLVVRSSCVVTSRFRSKLRLPSTLPSVTACVTETAWLSLVAVPKARANVTSLSPQRPNCENQVAGIGSRPGAHGGGSEGKVNSTTGRTWRQVCGASYINGCLDMSPYPASIHLGYSCGHSYRSRQESEAGVETECGRLPQQPNEFPGVSSADLSQTRPFGMDPSGLSMFRLLSVALRASVRHDCATQPTPEP
jgi:hypothetical protein